MALGKAPRHPQDGTALATEHALAAFRGAEQPQHPVQKDGASLGSRKARPMPAFPLVHSLLSLPCPCPLVLPWAVSSTKAAYGRPAGPAPSVGQADGHLAGPLPQLWGADSFLSLVLRALGPPLGSTSFPSFDALKFCCISACPSVSSIPVQMLSQDAQAERCCSRVVLAGGCCRWLCTDCQHRLAFSVLSHASGDPLVSKFVRLFGSG